jgi:hypothetical protein
MQTAPRLGVFASLREPFLPYTKGTSRQRETNTTANPSATSTAGAIDFAQVVARRGAQQTPEEPIDESRRIPVRNNVDVCREFAVPVQPRYDL